MSSSTKFPEKYIQEIVKGSPQRKRLWVFDFDDTLVLTDSVTHVTTAGGKQFDLTPAEFVTYERRPDDVLDYSDFRRLINPRPIVWMNRVFKQAIAAFGREQVSILSARCVPDPIKEYLDTISEDVEVVTVDSGNPLLKMAWIVEAIRLRKLEEVVYFDDSLKNVHAVAQVRDLYPRVSISTWHVTPAGASLL